MNPGPFHFTYTQSWTIFSMGVLRISTFWLSWAISDSKQARLFTTSFNSYLNIFFKLKTPDFQKRTLYSNSTKRQILQFWIAFISSNLLVKILFCFFVLFAKVFQTAFQLWRWLRWKGCCLLRLIDKKNTKTGKQTETETETENCQKNPSTFLISLWLETSNNRVPQDFIQFPK